MSPADDRVSFAQQYLSELRSILVCVPVQDLARALEVLDGALDQRKFVFLVGNGGSAATASHMANDLQKGIATGGGKGIRAIALTDNASLLTAIANDESYEEVFSGQLKCLASAGDVLIVFSGSGNSLNVVRAVETAHDMGLTTIGFLGMGGGKLSQMVDVSVVVPADSYGPIEDVNMVFDHLTMAYLLRRQQLEWSE